MKLTAQHLKAIALGPTDMSNINSIVDATNKYGGQYGMLSPHRLAHFIAQLGGESAGFRYDREIWGPTKQQRPRAICMYGRKPTTAKAFLLPSLKSTQVVTTQTKQLKKAHFRLLSLIKNQQLHLWASLKNTLV